MINNEYSDKYYSPDMNLHFSSSNEVSAEAGGDLRVVIVCEDAATTDKAADILRLLSRRLKDEAGRLFYQWWNFEFLAVPELGASFAAQTAAADMIIIGVHRGLGFPEPFAAWLRLLPELRKQRSGALVALLDPALEEWNSEPEMLSGLRQAATLSCLDFFATRAAAVTEAAAASILCQERPPGRQQRRR